MSLSAIQDEAQETLFRLMKDLPPDQCQETMAEIEAEASENLESAPDQSDLAEWTQQLVNDQGIRALLRRYQAQREPLGPLSQSESPQELIRALLNAAPNDGHLQ